jgi:Ca-activated chloride channel family protein
MIRFAHPDYLYGLALLPALVVFFWFAGRMRRASLQRFGTLSVLARLTESASRVKRSWQAAILVLAVGLLVVGLADPQIGTRMEEVKQEGVDLFIALDVSLSMKAEDMKPNRLEKAKLELRNLINRLTGDRIGLIVFAGEAFTQFPLTTDYSAANLFLDVVDVDAVPLPGTNIGAAIGRAMESFDFNAAKEAAGKGIILYAIGLGSPAGSPIPVYNASGQQVDFKRDRMGGVVVSKLDEGALEKIASTGNGKYFRGSSSQDELEEIYKALNSLQKREFGVKQFTDYEDRYQVFLFLALLLLVVEALLSEKTVRWIVRWNPLKREEEVKA